MKQPTKSVTHVFFQQELYEYIRARKCGNNPNISLEDVKAWLGKSHRVPKVVQAPLIYEMVKLCLWKAVNINRVGYIQVVTPKYDYNKQPTPLYKLAGII